MNAGEVGLKPQGIWTIQVLPQREKTNGILNIAMMMYIYGLYEILIAFDLGTFIITIEIYSRDDSYENGARKPCIYNESK